MGGHDRIEGRAGDDRLRGDAGNDTLDGGEGQDDIWGGAGDDVMTAARVTTGSTLPPGATFIGSTRSRTSSRDSTRSTYRASMHVPTSPATKPYVRRNARWRLGGVARRVGRHRQRCHYSRSPWSDDRRRAGRDRVPPRRGYTYIYLSSSDGLTDAEIRLEGTYISPRGTSSCKPGSTRAMPTGLWLAPDLSFRAHDGDMGTMGVTPQSHLR